MKDLLVLKRVRKDSKDNTILTEDLLTCEFVNPFISDSSLRFNIAPEVEKLFYSFDGACSVTRSRGLYDKNCTNN